MLFDPVIWYSYSLKIIACFTKLSLYLSNQLYLIMTWQNKKLTAVETFSNLRWKYLVSTLFSISPFSVKCTWWNQIGCMSAMSHLKKVISYINQRRNKKKSTLEMNILGLAKSWSTFIFFLSKGVNFCFDFLFVFYHNHWEIFHTKSQIQVVIMTIIRVVGCCCVFLQLRDRALERARAYVWGCPKLSGTALCIFFIVCTSINTYGASR